jgi:deoxyribodipyrimidine photolyase-related protein
MSAARPICSAWATIARAARTPQAEDRPERLPFQRSLLGLFARHVDVLGSNHRLALVYRQWQKFPPEQQSALRTHAQQLREQLDHL